MHGRGCDKPFQLVRRRPTISDGRQRQKRSQLAAVIVFVARMGGDNNHEATEHHTRRGDCDPRRGSARASLGHYGWRRRWRQYAWFVPNGTESEPERRQFVFRVER